MQTELVRTELQRLLRQTPFRSFIIAMKGGERAVVEHPENVAFDPRPGAATEFYALTGGLRLFSTFEAISSLMMLSNYESSSEERIDSSA